MLEDKAKELGRLIGQSTEYQALKRSSEALNDDRDAVTLLQQMEKLRGEATNCYSWSNGPGDRYAPHSHGYEKVLYCVDGSIAFVLEQEVRRLELKAGDRMVLPAGTVHSAEVGPGGCTCIEGRR